MADKWLNVESNIIEAITSSLGLPSHPFNLRPLVNTRMERVVVTSTADLHLGKRVWNPTHGVVYNQAIAQEKLMSTASALANQMQTLDFSHAVLCIGGDDLHIDTYSGATTNNTPQDMDGTPDEVIANYLPTVIPWIDFWRDYADHVDVLVTPGNHNRVLAQALGLAVQAHYRNDEDVFVDASPLPRKYVRIGSVLLGFAHGEKGKPHDYSSAMANEARLDWGNSRHRYFFLQHQHHTEVKDTNGVVFFRNPSLGEADRWHSNNLYAMSTTGATAYTFAHDGSFTHHFVKGV